jgi:hypothetical protein
VLKNLRKKAVTRHKKKKGERNRIQENRARKVPLRTNSMHGLTKIRIPRVSHKYLILNNIGGG